MRRLLALLVLTLALAPALGGTALACSCAPPSAEDAQRYADEKATAVYVGEVVRVEEELTYVVRVGRSLRGRVSGMRRLRGLGRCNPQLRPGPVFVTEFDGTVGACSTLTTQSGVDVAEARWVGTHAVDPPPPDRALLIGVAAALIALAGGAAVRSARGTRAE